MDKSFKVFYESNQLFYEGKVFKVSLNKLYSPSWKIEETLSDVKNDKLSRTEGVIKVSKMGPGKYFVIDGNHRVIQAIMNGLQDIDVILDEYVPDITRAGGAYDNMLAQTVQIISKVTLSETPAWNDQNKSLGKYNDVQSDLANYQNYTQSSEKFAEITLGKYLIEGWKYKQDVDDCYVIFAFFGDKIVGKLTTDADSVSPSIKLPKVNMVMVYQHHQGQGIAFAMYKMIIEYAGGLASSEYLTGEDKTGGSFNVWEKLSGIYNAYIYDKGTDNLQEVKRFSRKDMKDSETIFIVSKPPLS